MAVVQSEVATRSRVETETTASSPSTSLALRVKGPSSNQTDNTHVTPSNPKPGHARSLINHVKVYVLADFLDISALKEVASKKFQDLIATKDFFLSSTPEFVAAMEEAFTKTRQDDLGLRGPILRHCLPKVHGFSSVMVGPESPPPENPEVIREFIQRHEPVAWPLLLEQYEALFLIRNENKATVQEFQAKIDRLEAQVRFLEYDLSETRSELKRAVAITETYDCCRHCKSEFRGELEWDKGVLLLRCMKCRCRHT